MFDIVAHLALAAIFMVGVRWVQLRPSYDVLSVGAVGYIVSCGLSFLVWVLFTQTSPKELIGDLRASGPALLTGAVLGLGYFVAFFLLLRTLDLRGAAISTALSRLAVLVPIALAVVIWGERPSPMQWIGVAVSMAAVIMMNTPQRSAAAVGKDTWIVPIAFFLVSGGAFSAQETFSQLGQPAQQPLFLACGFAVAAAGSLAILFVRRITLSALELTIAAILGTANAAQVLFLLRALDRLPSFLVFAVTGAGGVIGTVLIAAVLLRERPTGLRALGIGVAAVALVLLQMR